MAELEVRVSCAEAGKGYVGSHAEAKDQLVRCLHGEGTGRASACSMEQKAHGGVV